MDRNAFAPDSLRVGRFAEVGGGQIGFDEPGQMALTRMFSFP